MKSLNLDINDIHYRYNILKHSAEDIAKCYNCGITTIYRYMDKFNIPRISHPEIFKRLRQKESFKINSVKKIDVETQHKICSEYANYGVNAASLGREYNVTTTSIHKILMKHDIPTKSRREIFGDSYNGNGNPNWNPNREEVKTLFHEALRQLSIYKNWRTNVFERDKYQCVMCNSIGNMEAHHIVMLKTLLQEHHIDNIEEATDCIDLWNINNGITLCRPCHNKTKWHEIEYKQTFKEAIIYEQGN